MSKTIWGTAESDAWSRDFDYAGYLMICDARDVVPLLEVSYELICQALQVQMVHDFTQEAKDAEERNPLQGDELSSGFESL